MTTLEKKAAAQADMDEFFATHSYNAGGNWRQEPLTAEDPDDDETTEKSLPVVRLNKQELDLP